MKKVLITGGAGFIGSHLAKLLLKKNYQVDLLDNFSRGVNDFEITELAQHPQLNIIEEDLLDSRALDNHSKDYHFIFHLAAIIGVAHVLRKPYNVLRDNVIMLDNIINFAKKQSNLNRLIFASTSEVYAGALDNNSLPFPTPEKVNILFTDLEHPRISYRLSKIYGEALCYQSNLPFTIIRPHNIYGPRMGLSHVIPELMKKVYSAKSGESIEVFSVNHTRTFCYIEDAIEIISRAAESEQCNKQVLNIGSEKPEIQIKEVAETIIDVSGKNINLLSKPDESGSPSRRCPDMTKVANLLGYEAQVNIVEGIKKTFEWYKKNVFEEQKSTAQ
jgi:UDP-glucose 4-epimerase